MRKTVKIIVVLLKLIILPYSAGANTGEPATKYIGIGAGWTYGGLRDYGISPLYYSGHHASGEAGYLIYSDSLMVQIEAGYSHGTISPSIYPGPDGSKMKSIKASADLHYLRYAGSIAGDRIRIYAGGMLTSRFGYYEHNNLMNSARKNYIFSALNLGGGLAREINAGSGRSMIIFTVEVPVVSLIMRPSYSYIRPEGFLNHNTGNLESFFSSIEISSVNRFTGAGTSLAIERKLNSGNKLSLRYRWEYFDHKNPNRLKSALHGLSIKTLFSL